MKLVPDTIRIFVSDIRRAHLFYQDTFGSFLCIPRFGAIFGCVSGVMVGGVFSLADVIPRRYRRPLNDVR